MGLRNIRIANLPPEVKDIVIRNVLGTYRDITKIKEELWTNRYRYKLSNGIRLVNMNLKHHIPSHILIEEHRVLISYDGQPATCYGCNATGHQYMHCPSRKTSSVYDCTVEDVEYIYNKLSMRIFNSKRRRFRSNA